MKALLKQGHGLGMDGVSLVDIPVPTPKANEVLIKVMACGICGTDLHIINEEYDHTSPVVLGHEFTGTIAETGADVKGFEIGDQVIVNNINGCGHCHYCKQGDYQMCLEKASIGINLNGGMAEYVVAPFDHCLKVPENMVGSDAPALSEPLTCCVRAVIDKTRIEPGDKVLISGPGAIGQLCLQVAKTQGAFVVVSGMPADQPRLELAKKHGADVIISDTKELEKWVEENTEFGFDVVLECSGAGPALGTAIKLVRKQGQITQVGVFGKPVTADLDAMWKKEIKHTSSFATGASSWEKLQKLYAQDVFDLEDLISARFSLEDYKEAFAMVDRKEGFKVFLKP